MKEKEKLNQNQILAHVSLFQIVSVLLLQCYLKCNLKMLSCGQLEFDLLTSYLVFLECVIFGFSVGFLFMFLPWIQNFSLLVLSSFSHFFCMSLVLNQIQCQLLLCSKMTDQLVLMVLSLPALSLLIHFWWQQTIGGQFATDWFTT